MKSLAELIAWARGVTMTPAQLAEQRRSFVFGNCNIENPNVTREIVAEADRALTVCVDEVKP